MYYALLIFIIIIKIIIIAGWITNLLYVFGRIVRGELNGIYDILGLIGIFAFPLGVLLGFRVWHQIRKANEINEINENIRNTVLDISDPLDSLKESIKNKDN